MDIEKIKTCYNEVINDFDRIDILLNAVGGTSMSAFRPLTRTARYSAAKAAVSNTWQS